MADKLTDKQLLFCKEYMVDLNGKQAAIRAGYSENTAEVQASRLLSNDKVNAVVQELLAKRVKKIEVTADYVLDGIKALVDNTTSPAFDTYNPAAALKGYELLGKHLKMFTDRMEHSGEMTVNMGTVKIGDKDLDFNVGD